MGKASPKVIRSLNTDSSTLRTKYLNLVLLLLVFVLGLLPDMEKALANGKIGEYSKDPQHDIKLVQ